MEQSQLSVSHLWSPSSSDLRKEKKKNSQPLLRKLPRVLTRCFPPSPNNPSELPGIRPIVSITAARLQSFLTLLKPSRHQTSHATPPTRLSEPLRSPLPQHPRLKAPPPAPSPTLNLPRIHHSLWLGFLKAFKRTDNLRTIALGWDASPCADLLFGET